MNSVRQQLTLKGPTIIWSRKSKTRERLSKNRMPLSMIKRRAPASETLHRKRKMDYRKTMTSKIMRKPLRSWGPQWRRPTRKEMRSSGHLTIWKSGTYPTFTLRRRSNLQMPSKSSLRRPQQLLKNRKMQWKNTSATFIKKWTWKEMEKSPKKSSTSTSTIIPLWATKD